MKRKSIKSIMRGKSDDEIGEITRSLVWMEYPVKDGDEFWVSRWESTASRWELGAARDLGLIRGEYRIEGTLAGNSFVMHRDTAVSEICSIQQGEVVRVLHPKGEKYLRDHPESIEWTMAMKLRESSTEIVNDSFRIYRESRLSGLWR